MICDGEHFVDPLDPDLHAFPHYPKALTLTLTFTLPISTSGTRFPIIISTASRSSFLHQRLSQLTLTLALTATPNVHPDPFSNYPNALTPIPSRITIRPGSLILC